MALSFLVNGPLVDKIGGKRGIIIAAVGASLANIVLGVLTYLVVMGQLKMKLVVAFSVVYALNMYFQSYGAVSIIKVKAYWFHVRERGVFGAIFGTLISFGVYFAFDWGKAIVDMAKANPKGELGWLHATDPARLRAGRPRRSMPPGRCSSFRRRSCWSGRCWTGG